MIQRYKNKREKRHARIRSKVRGTASTPRLAVYRSNRYIYVQLIDDISGKTLIGIHSKTVDAPTAKERARSVGVTLAKKAKDQRISKVVFDRGGYRYHGQVKEVAEGAREGGLQL